MEGTGKGLLTDAIAIVCTGGTEIFLVFQKVKQRPGNEALAARPHQKTRQEITAAIQLAGDRPGGSTRNRSQIRNGNPETRLQAKLCTPVGIQESYQFPLAPEDINTASLEAASVQRLSTGILIAVVALSLISSTLIVWLDVGRNLIARLW